MKTRSYCLLLGLWMVAGANHVAAQGTAFTYQGQLDDGGSPANGVYDLEFSLYDALSGGNPSGSVTNSAMKVTDHAPAQGAILGKAMTGLSEDRGLVLVLVTLQ